MWDYWLIHYAVPSSLLLLAAYLLFLYSTRTFTTWTSVGISGPKPIPLFGNTLEISREGYFSKQLEWIQKYGKTFGIYFFRTPLLLTTDLDIVKAIYIKDFANFSYRSEVDNSPIKAHPADITIFSANGQKWRRQRNTMSPTFTSSRLKMMAHFITRCGENLCKYLDQKAGKSEPVDVKLTFGAYTLDVICGTALGFEANGLEEIEEENILLKTAKNVFKNFNVASKVSAIALCFPFTVPLLIKFGYTIHPSKDIKFIGAEMKQLVSMRKKAKVKGRTDLIQLLLEAEGTEQEVTDNPEAKILTLDEIVAQCLVAFIAGYETTSTLLQFLTYFLAIFPDKQARLYTEIKEKIGNADASYDNVNNVTYLDSCIRETMRIVPAIPFISRKARETRTIKGVTIPAGCAVAVSIYGVFQDPEIFPEPQKFSPERFETDEIPSIVRELGFGCGPRQCIGMRLALYEAKMAVTMMLQKFQFVKVPQTPDKLDLSVTSFIPTPKSPIMIGVRRRS